MGLTDGLSTLKQTALAAVADKLNVLNETLIASLQDDESKEKLRDGYRNLGTAVAEILSPLLNHIDAYVEEGTGSGSETTSDDTKADKVEGATADHLASLTSEGNLADSGLDKNAVGNHLEDWESHITLPDLLNSPAVLQDGDGSSKLLIHPAIRAFQDGTIHGRRYPGLSSERLVSQGLVELNLTTGNLDGDDPSTLSSVNGQAWLALDDSPERFGFPMAAGEKRIAIVEHHRETGVFRPVYGWTDANDYTYDHPTGTTGINNGNGSASYPRRKSSRKFTNARTSPNQSGPIYPTSVSAVAVQTCASASLPWLYFKFYVVGVDGDGLPDMSDIRGETAEYNKQVVGTSTYDLAGRIGTGSSYISEFPFVDVSPIDDAEDFYIVFEYTIDSYSSADWWKAYGASHTPSDNLHTESGNSFNSLFVSDTWTSWADCGLSLSWDIEFNHTDKPWAIFPEPADGYDVAAYLGSSSDNRELDADNLSSQKLVERPLDELLAHVNDGTAFSDPLETNEIPFAVVDHHHSETLCGKTATVQTEDGSATTLLEIPVTEGESFTVHAVVSGLKAMEVQRWDTNVL